MGQVLGQEISIELHPRARSKLTIAEPGKFVQEKRKEFGENGVSNMSEEDLTRDISAVSCDNDFLMARNLLRD